MTRASLNKVIDQNYFRSGERAPKAGAGELPLREKIFAVLITAIVVGFALYLAWQWWLS